MVVLIQSKGLKHCFQWYKEGICSSRLLWGAVKLMDDYKAELHEVTGIIKTTKDYFLNRFKVLYIVDFLPKDYLPFPILKLFKRSKIVVLMHSHPYGKGKTVKSVGWFKKMMLNFYCKGIDKALFFSPLSMQEAIINGALPENKCQLIHWGEDLSFINKNLKQYEKKGDFWLSTGKERRDRVMLSEIENEMDNFIYVKQGMPFHECQIMTSQSMGIVVIPNAEGLTYCTGLTTVVEACALGKPIVSVRNPYFPFDIEKEKCGIYARTRDEFIKAINKISTDDALYESMVLNCLRISKKYNMHIFDNELSEIIRKLNNE